MNLPMRVLVYGGSFDPPHRGHAMLLSAAIKKIRPDKVLIVPAYQAPLKEAPQASSKDRLTMARLGILDPLPLKYRKLCRIDAREARARRQVFTVETLGALKGDLHFVCGQDSAVSFPKWRNPSRLKKLATWWYGSRPGAKALPLSHFRRIPGRFPAISSSEIRLNLALGRDCTHDLHPAVAAFINKRRLYGKRMVTRLSTTLSPSRYAHTLNVAALAESLARRWGADPAKALLAGLLHDAGRRFRPPELARYARRRRLAVPERALILDLDPMLLHAYVSADLAKREFDVTDHEVLNAIRTHTLGAARLSLLDRILYVADACALDRAHETSAATRDLAFVDLDAALKRCVADKLIHAVSREAWLHPLTVHLWNSLAPR
ncbi:MAG: bis(5'-nucleosyl)-tetraphosphatase (symmetrical) YqeK [Elusimicrobia bacterium]|nr:bis(5'-nucleosyl)-tetraphosphatase (symmetrical) YqeK [Elusimicrobiota bacterium]